MKKIFSMLFALLVLVSFSVTAGATSQKFYVSVPNYYDKVTDNEWYTDEFLINDEPTEVTMTVEFYPATQSPGSSLTDANAASLKEELKKDPNFNSFLKAPEIVVTEREYKAIYASYITESNGVEGGVTCYYFYSDKQVCVVRFVSNKKMFLVTYSDEFIVNTLYFEDEFVKEVAEETESDYSSAYDDYQSADSLTLTEETTKEEMSFDEVYTLSMRNGISAGMLGFAVALVISKLIKYNKDNKNNKGKKLTNADKVALMTKKEQDTIFKVGNIALIAEVAVGVPSLACLAFAYMDLIDSTKSISEMDQSFRKLVIVAAVVLLLFFGGAVFLKTRYPYYSDGKFMYIRKMRKGKVPQVCADEPEPNAVSQAKVGREAPSLESVISRYAVKCNYTVEQQKEWLAILNKTISTISLGGNPIDADRFLQPIELEKAGNMLNTVGRTAFMVSKILSVTNLDNALNRGSVVDLVRAYCVLDDYSEAIKKEYREGIDATKTYIYNLLKNADLSGFAEKETKNQLYWAPVIFDGDSLNPQTPDFNIHVFPRAGAMINNGEKILCDSPVPRGYSFAKTPSGKAMHLRTIIDRKTGAEMVPLFTDIDLLFSIFSPNTPIGVVDYETACGTCMQEAGKLSGIVINPGKENRIIPANEFIHLLTAEQPQMSSQTQSDSKEKSKKNIKNIVGGIVCLLIFALLTILEMSDMKVFDFYKSEPFTILRYVAGIVASGILSIHFLSKRDK